MDTHSEYSTQYKQVDGIITVFEKQADQLVALHKQALERFRTLNDRLVHFHQRTEQLMEEVSRLAACIKAQEQSLLQPVEYSFQRLSHLVTQLQYHDIIRQKLEHIEQGNQIILKAFPSATSQSDTAITQWLSALVGVVHLHIALLERTQLEYNRAFQKMQTSLKAFRANTENVEEIGATILSWLPEQGKENIKQVAMDLRQSAGQLVADISSLLHQIEQSSSWEGAFIQLCGLLRELIQQLPASNSGAWSQMQLLEELEQLYTMESERTIFQRVIKPNSRTNLFEQVTSGEVELF